MYSKSEIWASPSELYRTKDNSSSIHAETKTYRHGVYSKPDNNKIVARRKRNKVAKKSRKTNRK